MKKVLQTISLLLIFALLSSSAPTIKLARYEQLTERDFEPSLIPSSAEDVISRSVYIESITIANPTGSSVTVTILDKQNTPREILGGVSISANTTYVIKMWGHYSPGGIRWSAGTNNVLVGYIRFRG